MKIGFTGTQIGMSQNQKEQFVLFLIDNNVSEFHHGDCIGSDEQAHDIVQAFFPDIPIIIHPPINSSKRAFCKGGIQRPAKDYLIRNRDIVDETQKLVGAPKSDNEELRSGTWATIRYARKVGKLGEILRR